MATVLAPYPSKMDAINGMSVVTMDLDSATGIATFKNRADVVVASLQVRNPSSSYVKSIRRAGSFDAGYRDVLVKEWYVPNQPNAALANPGFLPAGQSWNVAWSPDSTYLAVAHSTSPFFTVYKLVGDVLTKIANPTTLPTEPITALTWSPDGKYLLVGSQGSPAVSQNIWMYSRTADTLTFIGSGASILNGGMPGRINEIAWARNQMYLAIASDAFPNLWFYKRNTPTSTVFTKLSTTFSFPFIGSTAGALSWSNDCNYVLFANYNSANPAFVIKRSADEFSLLPTVMDSVLSAREVAWALDDSYVVIGYGSDPYLAAFAHSNGIFTRITTGMWTAPNMGSCTGLSISPNARYVYNSPAGASYMTTYKKIGNSFSAILNPTTVMPGNTTAQAISASPDGRYVAVVTAFTPYLAVYKSSNGPIPGAAVRIDPNGVVVGDINP